MEATFRIKELREQREITRPQLAAILGLKSSSTVAMWETGDRRPSSAMLPQLANALGCTIDELYAKEGGEQVGA